MSVGGRPARQESQQTSVSGNRAYPFLSQTLSPVVRTGVGATNALAQLLNIGGAGRSGAQNAGFQNFLSSTGYQFQLEQGMGAITGSNAARGLLNSGETLRRLEQFGQGLAAQSFQTYLSNVAGVAQQGLAAAQTIGAAGVFSESQGTSSSRGATQGFNVGALVGAVGGFIVGGPAGAAAGASIGGSLGGSGGGGGGGASAANFQTLFGGGGGSTANPFSNITPIPTGFGSNPFSNVTPIPVGVG